MKRKLLICLAFLATAGMMSAQTTLLKAPEANELTNQVKKSNKTFAALQKTDITAKPVITRADEPDEILTYFDGDKLYKLSLGMKGTISAAVYFPAHLVKKIKGNKVSSIYLGILDKNASNVSVWMGTKIDNRDICNLSLEPGFPTDQTFAINLNEPYEIGDEGFYVGYTMTASDTKTSALAVSATPYSNSMFLDLGDGEGWGNYSGNPQNGSLYIECATEGGKKFANNDVSLDQTTYNRAKGGDKFEVSGLFSNYGKEDVTSINVSYTLNGETKEANFNFDEPVKYFEQNIFTIKSLTTPSAEGRHPVNLTVKKINGKEDGDPTDNTIDSYIISLVESSPRTVVFEEGTGTWCGWCPRGAVGMELLKERYSDSAIGIAVHSGDGMELNSYAPVLSMYSGFPSAFVNRQYMTDPYFGNSDTEFGLGEYVETLKNSLCEGTISNFVAEYTDNNKESIKVKSTVQFNYTYNGNDLYRMAYVIVEDGVTGYTQTNYYNREILLNNGYGQDFINSLPDELKVYVNKPSAIKDMVYNDVAVGIYDCLGVEGSLEGNITKGESKSHTYSITLPSNIQNKNNIRVVALLLEPLSGEIINAKQATIGNPGTGIKSEEVAAFTTEINVGNDLLNIIVNETATAELYNVDGTQVATTEVYGSATIPTTGLKGIYIVRVNNGKDVVVKKIAL